MKRLMGSKLVMGYGNPGRLDDGLGPALAEAVRHCAYPRVSVESEYQLAIEHAELVARFDTVIFADASLDGPEPFVWRSVLPDHQYAFTSHQLSPETVLGLAHNIFHARTVGYLIGVQGYAFDGFGEQLSDKAQENLAAALEWLRSLLDPTALPGVDGALPVLHHTEEST